MNWFKDKILPWIVITVIAALVKVSYDVYAFSTIKEALVQQIEKNKEELSTNDKRLDRKVNITDFNKLHNKVDNILTGLCMIDEKTCRLKL